jgi:hypothetical protein
MVLGAFTLIAVLVILAAWQGRYRGFENFLRTRLHIKRISIFYLAVWAVTIVLFWRFFHEGMERWELLCLLLEVAGVTFLAREVYLTQEHESIKNKLERLSSLSAISDPREYYRKYSEVDHRPKAEVERELKNAEDRATLYADVDELKAQVPARREAMEGEVADLLSKKRRRLLVLGLCLVALALWGHGVLASTQRDTGVSRADPEFKGAISDLEKRLAGQGQRIADLEGEVAAQRKDIEAIKEENRHWHVHRPPSRCTCAPTVPKLSQ